MAKHDISNSDKYIDAQDVRKRIAELESQIEDATDEDDVECEKDELKILEAFAGEIGSDNLQHGCQLIHEDHFEEHAREMAGELHGKAVADAEWPFYCIDWTKAAEELQIDYTGADFDGVTYYFR